MRIRHDVPAFQLGEVYARKYHLPGIEVKARSDKCLAKCAAVVRGHEAYL